ncbi:MAG TPA: uroporphyrinogen-III synthase [Alphaproteobacteria bacterium]|nr:uroporphyrinogen-III synthase [Alphaproteobacteria bacterium]
MTRPLAILTRPAESCGDVPDVLRARGAQVLEAPMTRVNPAHIPENFRVRGRGIIFTSVQAVRFLPACVSDRDCPVFVVGEQTARAARAAGFSDIVLVAPTGQALAAALVTRYDPDRVGQVGQTSRAAPPLIHLRGRDVAFPLEDHLTRQGFDIASAVVYSADLVDDFEPQTLSSMMRVEGFSALFWSARAADHFQSLTQRHGLTRVMGRSAALCLSARVAESLSADLWEQITVSARPDRAGMRALAASMMPLGSCAPRDPPA